MKASIQIVDVTGHPVHLTRFTVAGNSWEIAEKIRNLFAGQFVTRKTGFQPAQIAAKKRRTARVKGKR